LDGTMLVSRSATGTRQSGPLRARRVLLRCSKCVGHAVMYVGMPQASEIPHDGQQDNPAKACHAGRDRHGEATGA
jgi:hypothetical protein